MDSKTFTALTGISTDARFNTLVELYTAELEEILGYPLDPSDWPDLYNETGKTRTDCPCPDVDIDNLDEADEVVGQYRLYDYRSTDKFLAIDPATEIHAVKLVKGDVTVKTYETSEYNVRWRNAETRFAQYLELCRDCFTLCGCLRECNCVQLAVDATWGFEDLPIKLQKVLAELIKEEYDDKSEIKSESRSSHSYTKFDKRELIDRFPALRIYAGPNGRATRPRHT